MEKVQSDLAKVIRERRSVKNGYTDKEVPASLVKELLEDARWAPTHGMREPWRFIFISSERKSSFVEDFVSLFPKDQQEQKRETFNRPAAFLFAVMNEDPRQKQWEENFAAISCMLQNFQLLAWERDLGVCWKTPPQINDPKFREMMGVQPGEKIVGFIHLGYFDQEPKQKTRKPVDDIFSTY
ncbi:nitroreductase [Halobacillus litoralis]|uniref:nitroreductase family protein n=1 Tax=Halobacillus litoralis TaxID=45668 RepID=UPI001CD6DE8E|nr:nitroreductase [Halobacillus litoralis]MCA0968992.1 nitroreductase [Halobacillus litoralis]